MSFVILLFLHFPLSLASSISCFCIRLKAVQEVVFFCVSQSCVIMKLHGKTAYLNQKKKRKNRSYIYFCLSWVLWFPPSRNLGIDQESIPRGLVIIKYAKAPRLRNQQSSFPTPSMFLGEIIHCFGNSINIHLDFLQSKAQNKQKRYAVPHSSCNSRVKG